MKFNLLLLITLCSSLVMGEESASNEKNNIKVPSKPTPSRTNSKILGMSVIGNKESPRSLTIVPWRDPAMKGKAPSIIPVWQPSLGLLEPDSYRRNINLFLKHKSP